MQFILIGTINVPKDLTNAQRQELYTQIKTFEKGADLIVLTHDDGTRTTVGHINFAGGGCSCCSDSDEVTVRHDFFIII